jgi:hypothetical protein
MFAITAVVAAMGLAAVAQMVTVAHAGTGPGEFRNPHGKCAGNPHDNEPQSGEVQLHGNPHELPGQSGNPHDC